jgi:Universal stress protein family
MSEENVERACRFIERVNRAGELGPDFDSVFHPEMEFEDEIGAYHTRDEVRAFLQGFAEAIVVGSRGLSGLRERLEGSTSNAVAKRASCPVVLVHDD